MVRGKERSERAIFEQQMDVLLNKHKLFGACFAIEILVKVEAHDTRLLLLDGLGECGEQLDDAVDLAEVWCENGHDVAFVGCG